MNLHHLAGQKLGQYELREMLGMGGMGAVYRAYQSALKREVAVKIITPQAAQQPDYVQRFNREAEVAATLEHPHIVSIYDYGTEGQISYVVMRLLPGGSLDDRFKHRATTGRVLPSYSETAQVIKQVAGALDYAHSKGIIHRDVKPSNVMFDQQGNAYLVDFGIAKLLYASVSLTGTGVAMGTPLYMSPEQWRAEDLTPAADQYALGVMAYALVTGQPPFDAPTPFALMHKHLNEAPTPPREVRADIPPALCSVLERVLAKSPADRFPNVTAFAQAFEQTARERADTPTGFFVTPLALKPPIAPGSLAASGPVSAPGSTSQRRTTLASLSGRLSSNRPLLIGLSTLVVVILLVVIALLVFSGGDEHQPSERGAALSDTPEITATDTPLAVVILPTDPPADTPAPTLTATPSASATATATASATLTLTLTATPTITLTATETPDIEASALALMNDRLTQTAASWTDTPTPDIEATAEAMMIAAMTGTAEQWTDTPTPSATPSPTLTITPSVTPSLTATFTLTPSITPSRTPTRIPPSNTPRPSLRGIRPSSSDESRQYPGIWDGLSFINLDAPGVQSYEQVISAGPHRWAFSWCGTDEQHFQTIIAPFSIAFEVDGIALSSSALLEFDSRSICRNWITVLDGWQSGSRVALDIHYYLSRDVPGAEGIRSAGHYYQRIYVNVR